MKGESGTGDGTSPGDPPRGFTLEPDLEAAFGFADDSWQRRAARAVQPASPMGSLAGYSLLQELGRGGQGSVYKAIQPGTGRVVAIKRLGSAVLLGDRQSVRFRARYHAEIEALTRLQHPCIVTVHAAEVLEGHPLLVMEFARGEPIDRWAQSQWRTGADPISSILACFRRVCAGVSHAHQRGVIHRDIKPSNIIVHGAPAVRPRSADAALSVKVLDFGIARLIDGWRDAGLSAFSGFAGTPAYASPEQLTGRHGVVDTRSDVYSLGVLLCALLSGQEPCPPGASIGEVIESIGRARRPSLARPGVPRELDLIVLKATQVEAADRYQSVDALGDDVRRFLEGRPIAAHPPGRAYVVRKFARRHRVACTLAAAAALAIVVLAGISTVQALRLSARSRELSDALRAQQAASRVIERARAQAETQERLAIAEGQRQRQTSDFLLGLVENIAASSGGRSTIPIEQLTRWIESPLSKVSSAVDPVVLARLQLGIATMHIAANRNDRAIATAQSALALLAHPADTELRTSALIQLASYRSYRGTPSPALAAAREALAAVEKSGLTGTPLHVNALRQLSTALVRGGRRDEAIEALRPALAIAEEGGQPPETRALLLSDMAARFYGAGQYEVATEWSRAAMACIPAEAQSESEACARALVLHGMVAFRLGDLSEAEQSFTRLCEDYGRDLGDGHIRVRNAMRWRARALHELERYDESARICERLLQLVPPAYETADPGTWQLHFRYAATLLGQGRTDEANRQLRAAITRGGSRNPCDVEQELQKASAALAATGLHFSPELRVQLGDLAWLVDCISGQREPAMDDPLTGGPSGTRDARTAPPALNVSDVICFMNRGAAGCP